MIPDHLVRLAPTDLPNQLSTRYDGGGLGVTLGQLVPEDRVRVHQVYEAVRAVAASRPGPDRPGRSPADPEFIARVAAVGSDPFFQIAQALGRATAAAGAPPLVHKVLHDLRGGPLTPLIGTAACLRFGPLQPDLLVTCGRLARDQCKVMRNGLTDLDPPRRERDRRLNYHGVEEIVGTWDGASVREHGREIEVTVRCAYRGGIAACCLENAAVDRVLYNHLNNAARFAADGRVNLSVFGVNRDRQVRWVVSNAITSDQREWLAALGPDLVRLYEGGVTRGGNGVGLASCADFVAAAFGVTASEAVAEGYLGARVDGNEYHAWFHWPALPPTAGAS